MHKRLIQLFNAGARPLSSDALEALLRHFEGADDVSNDRVQEILAELTVGAWSNSTHRSQLRIATHTGSIYPHECRNQIQIPLYVQARALLSPWTTLSHCYSACSCKIQRTTTQYRCLPALTLARQTRQGNVA